MGDGEPQIRWIERGISWIFCERGGGELCGFWGLGEKGYLVGREESGKINSPASRRDGRGAGKEGEVEWLEEAAWKAADPG